MARPKLILANKNGPFQKKTLLLLLFDGSAFDFAKLMKVLLLLLFFEGSAFDFPKINDDKLELPEF